MASFPAMALQVRPPADPLESYAKIVQLRSMMQEGQLRQQQMQGLQQENQMRQMSIQAAQRKAKEGEAFRQTFSSISQKMPDATQSDLIDATVKELSKNPIVSPDTLQALQLHSQDLRTRTTTADDASLKLRATQIDNLRGAFKPIYDMPADTPPEQLEAAYQQQRAAVLQNPTAYGVTDPAHVPEHFPGKDAGQLLMTSMVAESKQNQEETARRENLLKAAQTSEATGKGAQAQAEAAKANRETPEYLVRMAGLKAAEEAKARQPYELQLAAANRQAAQQTALGTQGTEKINSLWADPQHGYSQFISQANATKSAIGQAQNGSQLAASMEPLMMALGVTSFAGVHRINQTEVNSAGPQVGSVFRRLNAFLDKAGSGSIPAQSLREANGLVDSLIDARHNASVQSSRVTAANARLDPNQITVFDRNGNLTTLDQAGKTSGGAGGPAAGGAAKGYTRIQASDGSIHDIPTGNLGAARQRDPKLQVMQW